MTSKRKRERKATQSPVRTKWSGPVLGYHWELEPTCSDPGAMALGYTRAHGCDVAPGVTMLLNTRARSESGHHNDCTHTASLVFRSGHEQTVIRAHGGNWSELDRDLRARLSDVAMLIAVTQKASKL